MSRLLFQTAWPAGLALTLEQIVLCTPLQQDGGLIYANICSARALVKKTQEPGIKLQKADFFRNDTWTSPQTNSEGAPKIPLVHFF